MLAALRSRSLSSRLPLWKLGFPGFNRSLSSSPALDTDVKGLLNLQEIEQVLSDVKADDVKVIPSGEHCDWTDYMVLATGRSSWHIRNIAQALIYKAKKKQEGVQRMVLPSVEGEEGGKWIVVDSGRVIVHALDENARAYYNLENLWTTPPNQKDPEQDLAKPFVKIRRKNNSKKRVQKSS